MSSGRTSTAHRTGSIRRGRPSSTARCAAQLAEHDFDVIHSQSSSALPLLWRRSAGLPPIVLSLHGNYVSIVKAAVRARGRAHRTRARSRARVRSIVQVTRLHFAKGNWRLFRRCEASVPSRSQIRPSRWSHLLRRGHVHVVRSGVDTRVFRPREQLATREALGIAAYGSGCALRRPSRPREGAAGRDRGARAAQRTSPTPS